MKWKKTKNLFLHYSDFTGNKYTIENKDELYYLYINGAQVYDSYGSIRKPFFWTELKDAKKAVLYLEGGQR